LIRFAIRFFIFADIAVDIIDSQILPPDILIFATPPLMRRRCRRAFADYAPPFRDLFRHDYYCDIALRFFAILLVCFLHWRHFLHRRLFSSPSPRHIYADIAEGRRH
jgi:hypothetical protein